MKAEDIKGIVKEKYSAIAKQNNSLKQQGCCSPAGCCEQLEFSMIGDDYAGVEGYVAGADMGLGCGLPTEFAGLKPGDNVLDLGCGAGNDCFVARSVVGETGAVTGIDFSEEMLDKANANLIRTGFDNIRFVHGDIENLPLPDETYDVVVSNCVLNLVPDKQKAFAEIYRVLKNGGSVCISDVVLNGYLPDGLKEAAEMYAGCVSGAVLKEEYLEIVKHQGFSKIKVRKEKPIAIPGSVLRNYLTEEETDGYNKSGAGIVSITLTAIK